MPTEKRSTARAILHVADYQQEASRKMQSLLAGTGRQVVRREDLYGAMGALIAARRGQPLAAMVIYSTAPGPGEQEFFRLNPSTESGVPIYYYGPAHSGEMFEVLKQAAVRQIEPEDVPGLLAATTEVLASEPAVGAVIPSAVDEAAPEDPGAVEREVADAQGLRERQEALADPSSAETEQEYGEDSLDDLENLDERPPVPWRPSQRRPVRTPPGGNDKNEPTGSRGQGDPPLLTRDELDALLDPQTGSSESTEHTV